MSTLQGRVRISFTPKWEGEIRGFAIKFAMQNEWRTLPDYDLDDLIQEYRIIFWMLTQKYPEVIEPRHFMALFKVSCINITNRYSNRRTRRRNLIVNEATLDADLSSLADGSDSSISEAEINVLLTELPETLGNLVRQLGAGVRTRPRRETKKVGRLLIRETNNQYACRVAGADPAKVNLIEAFARFLKGEPVQC